jgi:hypothetical protein
MKTEFLGGKIRGKIDFLGGEKETRGVGKEFFMDVGALLGLFIQSKWAQFGYCSFACSLVSITP